MSFSRAKSSCATPDTRHCLAKESIIALFSCFVIIVFARKMHRLREKCYKHFTGRIPFKNNLAERDIRPAKVKQKISNCFRTATGANIYARIEGFVSTARKNNRNVFSELCATFESTNFIAGQNPVNNYIIITFI